MTSTPSLIQGKYIIGKHSVVGDPRRKWEDRVFTAEIPRTGGDSLIVGIVADGVGSADFGARGAQLAIDTTVRYFTQSQGTDIPKILETAIEMANRAVFQDNEQNEGDGLTTLVVAVIYNDRCYIGNVGDSRGYWVQSDGKGKLLQLTRDHNYFNIYGGVDPNSDEGSVVVNAIGKKPEVQVDLGFYLKGDDVEQAYRFGIKGLPMKPGDTIVLCSDGLIKSNRQGERYVKDEEIIESVLTEMETDRAAIKMVSAAEGRRPDDNVSVVTLQCLSESVMKQIEANRRREKTNKLLRQSVPVAAILVFLVIGFFAVRAINSTINPTVQILPTYTPYPTLAVTNSISVFSKDGNVIGRLVSSQGQAKELVAGIYTIDKGTRIEITQNGAGISLADGSGLYMPMGTVFVFARIDGGVQLMLERGSIMVNLRSTPLTIYPQQGQEWNAQVMSSLMGIHKSEDSSSIFIDCFGANCLWTGGTALNLNLIGPDRYIQIVQGSISSSNETERCRFWEDAIGPDTVSALGITCTIPPTETPSPTVTPTPRNVAPLGTPKPKKP